MKPQADPSKAADGTAIAITGLVKTFGFGATAVHALKRVDLDIQENEFFTLLGPSGCGKTTLLRLIAGFEMPSDGSIFLGGKDIALQPPHLRPINTVFQSYALFPHLTVAENIGFGLKMQGRPKAEITARVAEMLRLVQMEPMAGRRTSEISGGQQQRVALARALAPKPRILLLDEPLSALDYKLRKEMQTELKRLQVETGITFIFVTHDQEEALTMSDRIAVLNRGSVLQVGTPRQIYSAPCERFVADFIGESNFLTGLLTAHEGPAAVVQIDGASLRAKADALPPVGSEVTVMIRPEDIDLTWAEQPDTLPATLSKAIYNGPDTNFTATLANSTVLTIRGGKADLPSDLTAGQKVWLRLRHDAARIVRD